MKIKGGILVKKNEFMDLTYDENGEIEVYEQLTNAYHCGVIDEIEGNQKQQEKK